MGKVTFYENLDDFKKYVKKIRLNPLGVGSEADAYLTKDLEVIKDYRKYEKEYKPGLYIMDGDIKLDSFIFPKELYVYNGMVCGARMDFFNGDLFNTFAGLEKIDLDKLVEAREKFIEDIKVMTKEGYKLYELYANVLYNNKYLKAIDTMNYKKEDVDLDTNIRFLDAAIMGSLQLITNGAVDYRDNFDDGIQLLKKMRG